MAPTATARIHVAPVQLGESLDERETDAESTRRAIRCRLGLKEQIEHSGQVFGRDATSVVADFEHRLGALARRAHADVPTRRRVRRGIDEEIRQDLLDAGRIAVDPDRGGLELDMAVRESARGLQ